MRVLVCGGRDHNNPEEIWRDLDALHNSRQIEVLIEGGAKGADLHAKTWALRNSVQVETYKAEWRRLGKSAGPRRNQRMLDEGKPDRVLAYPTDASVGTWDMIAKANAAGVHVTLLEDSPPIGRAQE